MINNNSQIIYNSSRYPIWSTQKTFANPEKVKREPKTNKPSETKTKLPSLQSHQLLNLHHNPPVLLLHRTSSDRWNLQLNISQADGTSLFHVPLQADGASLLHVPSQADGASLLHAP